MGATESKNRINQGIPKLPSGMRGWIGKCWKWFWHTLLDRDSPIYMAPNFKLDN